MKDPGLISLMSELARLLAPRSNTPRSLALGIAYRKIHSYAQSHNLTEEWCDKVLMLFLSRERAALAA